MSRGLFLVILIVSLCGCSLYQSDGREFLEDKAFDFGVQNSSVKAKSVLPPCAEVISDLSFLNGPDWTIIAESYSPSYQLYRSRRVEHGFALIVEDERKGRNFVCDFQYSSEEEYQEEQARDIHLGLETIENLY